MKTGRLAPIFPGLGKLACIRGEFSLKLANQIARVCDFTLQGEHMIYSQEVQNMCPVAKGCNHGPAPIPEEGKWVQAKEIKDISGMTHGIGWCAPQQGACKL